MIPLDDETLVILDRIAARRTPGRLLRHPRTGKHVDFLLAYQGRRISDQASAHAVVPGPEATSTTRCPLRNPSTSASRRVRASPPGC
jgi:hypothetical protein